ncbi:MAG TPA: hypothetical protein VNW99_02540 [Cytophagaceae bacterium]|jgi:hypothetical protein|nr:hypothetical protein [Cytophagaceae bacterium]
MHTLNVFYTFLCLAIFVACNKPSSLKENKDSLTTVSAPSDTGRIAAPSDTVIANKTDLPKVIITVNGADAKIDLKESGYVQFLLPEKGKITQEESGSVYVSYPIDTGTNMTDKIIHISATPLPCDMSEYDNGDSQSPAKVTIGNKSFNTLSSSDAGAGHYADYKIYYFEKAGFCIMFVLEIRSFNREAVNPSPKQYDDIKQKAFIEKMIAGLTISSK